jgi:2-dehydro-3-deoxy-D-arabinonate dehydratase
VLVYRVKNGLLVQEPCGEYVELPGFEWASLFVLPSIKQHLREHIAGKPRVTTADFRLLPPIDRQEVWAAGVTYLRSRTARMEESAAVGGSDFYDMVYHADRPELFFKATPQRVVGHEEQLKLRSDSRWMVPEPELTLAFGPKGDLVGYTIGNDLSSRDIEGDNPLYLPQAKIFDGSAALGPGLYLTNDWPTPDTSIEMSIARNGETVFAGRTEIGRMKQTLPNLRDYLFRHCSFADGCYLMTGTGIVPDDEFTLQRNDRVEISIPPVGTLINDVA